LLNSKHLEKIRKKLAVIQLNNKNNKHSDKLPDVFLCNNIDNYVCQYCFKTLVKSYKKMYTYYSIEDRSEVMKNKKNVIMITMCVLMLLMATGYAYFVTQLNINATGNITSEWNVYFSNITSGTIVGKASNSVTPSVSGTTANIEANLELPGDSITYELTLSNVGTVDAIIDDINVEVTGSSAIIYSMDGIKIGDKLIAKENKTITIKIEYDSNVTSQPIDTTKSLKVSISCVQDMGQIIDSVLPNMSQPIRLSTKILKDNIAYADNVASTYVSSETGIDFSQPSSDTNGKGLYYTSTNTEGNKKVYYFRGDVENNYVKIGNLHSEQNVCLFDGEEVINYASNYGSNKITEASACSNVCLMPEGSYVSGGAWPHEVCTEQWGGTFVGVAQWGTQELLWRIVRINEDGSVRLIADITVGNSQFNPSTSDNAYVGYMYGTTGSDSYKETHKNTNNSTIKTYLDNWYANNLISYSSYLSDSGFCSDRSIASSAGMWSSDDTALGYSRNNTFYGVSQRTKQPQFKCPQKSDLFTLATSSKGNKKLIYPVGLLTYDEALYAGVDNSDNAYLVNGTDWWIMTPYAFHTAPGGAVVPYVSSETGTLVNMSYLSSSLGVRPVINLRGDLDLLDEGADGTRANPYTIKTN